MNEIELKEYLRNQKRVGQSEDNSSFEGGLKHMIHVGREKDLVKP